MAKFINSLLAFNLCLFTGISSAVDVNELTRRANRFNELANLKDGEAFATNYNEQCKVISSEITEDSFGDNGVINTVKILIEHKRGWIRDYLRTYTFGISVDKNTKNITGDFLIDGTSPEFCYSRIFKTAIISSALFGLYSYFSSGSAKI